MGLQDQGVFEAVELRIVEVGLSSQFKLRGGWVFQLSLDTICVVL